MSRTAITVKLQEWREAYDEYSELKVRLMELQAASEKVEEKMSLALDRENEAREKINVMVDSHADDSAAVDDINALIGEYVVGVMGAHVVSGGVGGEMVV